MVREFADAGLLELLQLHELLNLLFDQVQCVAEGIAAGSTSSPGQTQVLYGLSAELDDVDIPWRHEEFVHAGEVENFDEREQLGCREGSLSFLCRPDTLPRP